MWQRLKRLWKLSQPESEGFKWTRWIEPQNQSDNIATRSLHRQEEIFIPRNKRDPVKEIIQEQV